MFSKFFIFTPLLVLLIFAIVSAGLAAASGSGYAQTFCAPSSGGLQCTSAGGNTTYVCPAGGGACNLNCNGSTCSPACPSPLPANTSCSPAGFWFLNAGSSITLSTATISALYGSGSSFSGTAFAFPSFLNNPAGYTALITVLVSVAVVAGVGVLGIGLSPEAVHILFIEAGLLGLWGILSVAEGYVWGSSTSGFAYIDSLLPGAGLAIYVVMTLMYAYGAIGAISRGEA